MKKVSAKASKVYDSDDDDFISILRSISSTFSSETKISKQNEDQDKNGNIPVLTSTEERLKEMSITRNTMRNSLCSH